MHPGKVQVAVQLVFGLISRHGEDGVITGMHALIVFAIAVDPTGLTTAKTEKCLTATHRNATLFTTARI